MLAFFFNDTATTEIYTLSLHDALPISFSSAFRCSTIRVPRSGFSMFSMVKSPSAADSRARRSEEHRLNSSHVRISYAVFCLKKKKHDTRNRLDHHPQAPAAHHRYLTRA